MKLIEDITKFKSELFSLLGFSAEEEFIRKFVDRWNKAATNYNEYVMLRKKFENQIKTLNIEIKELQNALYVIKKTNFEEFGDPNATPPNLLAIQVTTNEIERKILNEAIYRDLAIYEKDSLKSKDSQMTIGIIELFKFGEAMKLDIKGETGAGRGNKNKIFALFQTITGIVDKNTFFYYRDVYINSIALPGAVKRVKPLVINGLKVALGIAEYKKYQNTLLQNKK